MQLELLSPIAVESFTGGRLGLGGYYIPTFKQNTKPDLNKGLI
jgi:hypothetical protein